MKVIDETGKRYGRLTVVERMGSENGKAAFLCQCDCGNQSVVTGDRLRRGITQSCGCLKHEGPRLSQGEAAFNAVWGRSVAAAHHRNLDWDLTKEQFRKLTQMDCWYCGAEPLRVARTRHPATGSFIYNGVDRVDNNKGYQADNVVPCCWICNRAKGTMSYKKFLDWLERAGMHERSVGEVLI